MADLQGFDAEKVEPATGFDPIPEGEYVATITESEIKPTKAGTGSYLALTFQIVDGEFRNRNLWANLNLENPSEKAVQIAKAQLSAICRAVGIMRPADSSELHSKPLRIKVGLEKRNDTGEIQNQVKSFRPLKDEPAAPAAAAAGENDAPW